jgi:hypothetical protein
LSTLSMSLHVPLGFFCFGPDVGGEGPYWTRFRTLFPSVATVALLSFFLDVDSFVSGKKDVL